jgi:hypothetical protein
VESPSLEEQEIRTHGDLWDRFRVSRLRITSLDQYPDVLLYSCVIASTLSVVFKTILNAHDQDFTYWVYPTLLLCITEMTLGISCACMPATAGFLKGRSGGSRMLSGLSQVFGIQTLRSRYWKGSRSQNSESGNKSREGTRSKQIIVRTDINVDKDNSSMVELTAIHAKYSNSV